MKIFQATLSMGLFLVMLALVMPSGAAVAQGGGPRDLLSISPELRRELGTLITQDYQGRMKPIDTLANEMVRKITKRSSFGDLEPLDLYLDWLVNPEYWWDQPLIYVRHPGLKDLLGLSQEETHISLGSLFDSEGHYRLLPDVEAAHRTPDRERSKLQRKLISFDERLNILYLSCRGQTLRIFPIPGDPEKSWGYGVQVVKILQGEQLERFRQAFIYLMDGLQWQREERLEMSIAMIHAIQTEFGAEVLPGKTALRVELLLNRLRPFSGVLWIYLLAFPLLMTSYAWNLIRHEGEAYSWRHPLFLSGMLLFSGGMVIHLGAFVMRWIASGRAPLSNGYESLLFIGLSVALAGFFFELKDKRGVASGLASLLTSVVLGIAMMSHFDPAIGLLVPVLDSFWLNIHVTVITASYGFLSLGSCLGALILLLYLMKGEGRETVRQAIIRLDRLLFRVISVGLALLTVGTFLGGIWANESWGRYWGWDPKETWSLVTILIFAFVQHLRWVPLLNRAWFLAAGSFAGIASIVMTYFGVNYFLAGLHSYAQGGVVKVPVSVPVSAGIMVTLICISYLVQRTRTWGDEV